MVLVSPLNSQRGPAGPVMVQGLSGSIVEKVMLGNTRTELPFGGGNAIPFL